MPHRKFSIVNIMLASANGKIAFHAHESSAERQKNTFTCQDDHERMRKLVAECNVVFHGARSIESERGGFRVADLRPSQKEPEWIIFTQTGNISFQSPFWKQEGIPKSLFFATSFDPNALPNLRVEEKEFEFGRMTCYFGNITGLILYLKNKNYKRAALLGGGKLNSVFWENNLVDELYLTVSPFMVGGADAPYLLNSNSSFNQNLHLKNCTHKDSFVYLDYSLQE